MVVITKGEGFSLKYLFLGVAVVLEDDPTSTVNGSCILIRFKG